MAIKTITWDLETTGVDVENDRIITAYMKTSCGVEHNWIINAGVEVPKEAANIQRRKTLHFCI